MSQEKSNDSEKIKVIWIDDDPSRAIDTEFFKAGIVTTCFKLAEDAKKEFITHRGSYQAIILDMEGADKTVNEFARAIKEFEDLQKDDPIPIYIFTSYSETDPQYKAAEPTIYQYKIKGNRFYNKKLHREELIAQIKKDVTERESFKIKQKYKLAFGAFESGVLDGNYEESLVEICKILLNQSGIALEFFNKMRKIYENIFKNIKRKLPSEHSYGADKKNDTKMIVINYLNGQKITVRSNEYNSQSEYTIQIKKRVTSLLMEQVLKSSYSVFSDQSHDNPGLNWEIDPNLQLELPHFFESYALLLLDLIGWATDIYNSDASRFKEVKFTSDFKSDIVQSDFTSKNESYLKSNINLKTGECIQIAEVSPNTGKKEIPKVTFENNRKYQWPLWNKDEMNKIYTLLESDARQHKVKLVTKDMYEIVRIVEFLD